MGELRRTVLGFSGGKDSTACGETPTDNEAPEVLAHTQVAWCRVCGRDYPVAAMVPGTDTCQGCFEK